MHVYMQVCTVNLEIFIEKQSMAANVCALLMLMCVKVQGRSYKKFQHENVSYGKFHNMKIARSTIFCVCVYIFVCVLWGEGGSAANSILRCINIKHLNKVV